MNILLTGSSGFVGLRLLETWAIPNQLLPISIRDEEAMERVDWSGVKSVIHLGGLAHQIPPVPPELYFEVNEELTIRLAAQAKANGVRQFLFLSTIKVYGDDIKFMTETTPCQPKDAYGQSKLNAEKRLIEISDSSFVVSIIRSPLVIGPGAKGNLLLLMRKLNRPFPLPLLGIQNRRSMVALDNLIQMIRTLVERPEAGVFLAAEKESISTSQLAVSIRNAMESRGSWLVKMPFAFRKILRAIKPGTYSRLFGDSVIDNSWTVENLNFKPVISLEEAINQMVDKFLSER